ncbi:MAG: hypothetical protein Kow0042_24360 [Calditrichia bacterium]
MRRKTLKNNYKTIIGVSLLSLLLWFMVKMSRSYQYTIEIPIEYINLDPGLIFKYPQSGKIEVEFTGKGMDLLRLPFSDIIYQLDLSGAPMHLELNLSENTQFVKYPSELNVEVSSIVRPRILVVELDKKVSKKLPVELNYKLETPPGYILVKVDPQPDSILVTGPEVMFSEVQQIKTEEKIFTEATMAFREWFSIQKNSRYYAVYQPTQVDVLFDVQRLAEKEVANVPVTVIDVPSNLQVIPLPSQATIYVKGGEKILAELGVDDFQIIIDFKKAWKPGMQKVKADLLTQAEVLYMETRPPEFELIVQKQRSE